MIPGMPRRPTAHLILSLALIPYTTVRAATAIVEVPPEPLRFGSITMYTENDKYLAGTDRNYTNGFKLSALSTDLRSFDEAKLWAPLRMLAKSADEVLKTDQAPTEVKVGFSLGQNIYTPTDTDTPLYQPDDRPYAAWLYLGAAFHNYRPSYLREDQTQGPARLDVFEVNLGMVGPAALGEQVQNFVHDLIDVDRANGWDNQIGDEPGLNLIYERKWRYSSANARTGSGAEFIPHLGVSLGNVSTYANGGFEFRFGTRMPDNFGVNLIRPSSDSNARRRPSFNAFFFVLADGRGVARDITLDGSTFKDSPSVEKKNFVYDFAAGFSVGNRHLQLTYTQARRSKEFDLQDESQDFGSLSLSYYY